MRSILIPNLQARLAPSTTEQRGEHDGDPSVPNLYNNVLSHIRKNEKTKWCKELYAYAWYN